MTTSSNEYTKVAIILHWLIALCIISMLIMGFVMESDLLEKTTRFATIQFHKSLGLTILVLSLIRLFWRLSHTAPPLPPTMAWHERFAANAVHVLLYAIMIALPLSGWVMVSSSSYGFPTIWFGLFEWPHLPYLPDLETKDQIYKLSNNAHELLAWGTIALLSGHVGAALKHHFINRDDILSRMIPSLKRGTP